MAGPGDGAGDVVQHGAVTIVDLAEPLRLEGQHAGHVAGVLENAPPTVGPGCEQRLAVFVWGEVGHQLPPSARQGSHGDDGVGRHDRVGSEPTTRAGAR